MMTASETELKRLAKNIRRIRKLRAMTQKDLAIQSNTRPATISCLENAYNKNPGWDLIIKICQALDTSIHNLTLPDATSSLTETQTILPQGLQLLIDDQDKLLAATEPRISLPEVLFLKQAPFKNASDLEPEHYLQLLRFSRLLEQTLA